MMVDGCGQRNSGSTEGNGFVEVDVGVYKKYFSVFVFSHKKFQKNSSVKIPSDSDVGSMWGLCGVLETDPTCQNTCRNRRFGGRC